MTNQTSTARQPRVCLLCRTRPHISECDHPGHPYFRQRSYVEQREYCVVCVGRIWADCTCTRDCRYDGVAARPEAAILRRTIHVTERVEESDESDEDESEEDETDRYL